MLFFQDNAFKVIFVAFVFSTSVVYAQLNSKPSLINYNVEKQSGKVTLVEGIELAGVVTFNQNEGVVTITTNDETKSFNAKRLISFEFAAIGRIPKRVFYSLVFSDEKTGITEHDFFEVVAEFDSFAVVSRQGRLKSHATMDFNERSAAKRVTLYRSETIYFLDKDGHFFPYGGIIESENVNNLYSWKTNNMGNAKKSVLKKFTGEHYLTLKNYARKMELNLSDKEDLKIILEEYKRLSGI